MRTFLLGTNENLTRIFPVGNFLLGTNENLTRISPVGNFLLGTNENMTVKSQQYFSNSEFLLVTRKV
jgi:hypothetical protein